MKFVRDDYSVTKEKKNKFLIRILIPISAVLVLIILFSSVIRKNEGKNKSDEPQAAGKKIQSDISIDLPTIIKKIEPSIVSIITYTRSGQPIGQGTGFIMKKEGLVVTNRHVLRGADSCEVKSQKKNFRVYKIVGNDPKSDLALLKIGKPGEEFSPLSITSGSYEVGEKIFVIGNPMGLELSVSDGIVSAKRDIDPFGKVIQITSPISPGSSGSPVLNMKGEVIGIATFQLIQGQNINFAIPIERALKLEETSEKSFASMGKEINIDELNKLKDPFEKGMYLFRLDQFNAAIPFFEEALTREKNNAEAHLYLGACYFNDGLPPSKAEERFKTALQLQPEMAEAHYYLGTLYSNMNMKKEATEQLEEAVHLNPYYSNALIELAIVYFEQKLYQKAMPLLEKFQGSSSDPRVNLYLGMCYTEISEHLKAIRTFSRAIEMDPDLGEAYIAISMVFLKVKNWDLGIQYLNKGIMRFPRVAEFHFLMGCMYIGKEELESAELELQIMKQMQKNAKEKNEIVSEMIVKLDKMIRLVQNGTKIIW